MTIQDKLDKLADYRAQADVLALERQELIDKLITPEIKAAIAEIDAEFEGKTAGVNANIAALESEIKANVLEAGASVKGQFLQAVWSKGRISWDTKALDGYAAAHPEIVPFRKEGDPSVSIRKT